MSLYDREMLNELIVESREHLSTVEPDLLELEQKGAEVSDELINRIFRAVHSIKGGFGFFNIEKITRLSHDMENSLSRVRSKDLVVTSELTDALLTGVDKLRTLLDDVDNADGIPIEDELRKLLPFIPEQSARPSQLTSTSPTSKEAASFELDPVIRKKHPRLSDSQIVDAVKSGRLLYQIQMRSHTDIEDKNLTPISLFDEWEKIGLLLDIVLDFDAITGLEGSSKQELSYSSILASVLEADLISAATGIPGDQIYQIDTACVRNTLKQQKRTGTGADAEKAETPVEQTSATGAQAPAGDGPKQESRVEDAIRVKIGLLNKLMNLAGELVLSRNQLLQRANRTVGESLESDRIYKEFDRQVQQSFQRLVEALQRDRTTAKQAMLTETQRLLGAFRQGLSFRPTDLPGFHAIIQNIDRVTSLLQEGTMQTRLQPISVLFSKFPRIIRDLSKKCGKEVELTLVGQEVELDKSIIELLSDPLTHLVRNSVDHGVESPEKRRSAGKAACGQVVLHAFHESGKVNIRIQDDGGGIPTAKVKQKAIENGLVTAAAAEKMTDAEINRFILAPGFSTAEKVTDVSGRGVGMDVVKTNIERLGGAIDIATVPGKGTTITMQLPLTLAIISSLVVAAEGRRFAVPQVGIEELVRVRSKDIGRLIERVGQSEVYRLRGSLLPLIRLANVLDLQSTYIDPSTGERKPDRRARWSDRRGTGGKEPPKPEVAPEAAAEQSDERRRGGDRRTDVRNAIKIVVLHAGGNIFGLVVDEVFDAEEIVVKPLSTYLKQCGCYAGSTILGDGAVTMILDVNGIARLGKLKFTDLEKAQTEERERYAKEQATVLKDVLLFDNGAEERLGVELLHVARIEKVEFDRIEHMGTREFVRYDNNSLPLVRLQNYLPISAPKVRKTHQFVMVPKTKDSPIGVAIETVHDVVRTDLRLDRESMKGNGIAGSAILDKRITLIVDLPGLIEAAGKG